MVWTRRLQYLHPWIHTGVVIFARDTIGVDHQGDAAQVDQDVVVTDVTSGPSGVAVSYEPFVGERATLTTRRAR